MNSYILRRFFGASGSKLWQLFAATCIGALLGATAVGRSGDPSLSVLPAVEFGAAFGFIGGLMLLTLDALRSRKEARAPRHPEALEDVR